MFDQDFSLFTHMRVLSNVHQVVNKLYSLKGDEINKRLSNSERILLGKLDEMNLIGGLDG